MKADGPCERIKFSAVVFFKKKDGLEIQSIEMEDGSFRAINFEVGSKSGEVFV